MSEKTYIQWTGSTLTLTTGCDKVSPGCASCYACRDAIRMAGNPNPKVSDVYAGLAYRQENGRLNWTGVVRCVPERLAVPFRWARPRKIFVCNQSDLFHHDVPDAFIARAFEMMREASWHTFQILTKRAGRLAALAARGVLVPSHNVWVGVSVESQDFTWRIDCLRGVPATIRFLSVEPMLGPVNLDLTGTHQVITGGESGPDARPFDPAWALSVRDQCRQAGVCFFHKQNGGRNKKATGRLLDGRTYDEMPPDPPRPVPPLAARRMLAERFSADG